MVTGVPSRRSIGRSSSSAQAAGGSDDSRIRAPRRPSSSSNASATSSRSATTSAAAVPACSATSKPLRSSGSRRAYGQSSSQGTSATWPDEEIGSSSAGPWRAPSATAWMTSSPSLSRRGIGGGLVLAAPRPVAQHEVDDPDDDQRRHRVVDVVERVLPFRPVRAHLLADEAEHEHPRDAAEQGKRGEGPERHPGDAGGQRDERADDREHAAEEHGRRPPARKPAVGPLDVL